ncbi:hypothetical protein AN958_11368 [Leucoagaricus sp. SymC.cos]|nr:hypothetical protein AN958_11368 [Leucoagaricus sp. SymC.cos]
MGEYECQVVGHVHGEMFKVRTQEWKKNFAQRIISAKRASVWLDMKARIELRKEGKFDVSGGQWLIGNRIKEMRRRDHEVLTTADVIRAFENEQEVSLVLLGPMHTLKNP